MRKLKEILRLKYELGLSERQIAVSCAISRASVSRCLKRVSAAKLTWPLPESMDEATLEKLIYPAPPVSSVTTLDWAAVHVEMKRPAVTLLLLWEEYRVREPQGLSYSRYCTHYRQYKQTLEPVMRQTHKAGEKLFVDYAGMTVPWVEQSTGECFDAQIFVAVLGASNYTYIEATRSQSLQDWIGSHVRAFQFLGGVPEIIVPDNLKSGVTCAHRYDPDTNPTYQDMADHYGIAVVPARAVRPQDKSKVEVGVQGIERRILAKLRNHTFFSITQLNAALRSLLIEYNTAPFKQMPGSRLQVFETLDKPVLKSLPSYPYEYAHWKKVRAGIDYHVAFEHHYYSVPYRYVKRELDLKIKRTTVTILEKGKVLAVHIRAYQKGHTTITEHMPKQHQEYAHWTPERLLHWASESGEQTRQFIASLLEQRAHPQQAYRACLGVMRLGKQYGAHRLEKAAARAIVIGAFSYKSIESILKRGLDQTPLPTIPSTSIGSPISHENLRGAEYYH